MIDRIIGKAASLCDPNMADVVKRAFSAVHKAGKAIRELYGKPHNVTFKGEIDLVTEADYKSEEILGKALDGLFDASLIAEESATDHSLRNGRFWIVDPLDGTTNFAHGFPFFAPSVALVNIRDGAYENILGCIYVPILKEFFWALKGCGSFLNLERLHVSEEKSLSKALVATGFPYDVHDHPEDVISAFRDVIVQAQGIRRAGAAAIDLAYVACGRFDAFWEKKLKPWDTAAGMLLVEEAGGLVTDFKGSAYNPFVPEIVASNRKVHNDMIHILRGYSCQPTNT